MILRQEIAFLLFQSIKNYPDLEEWFANNPEYGPAYDFSRHIFRADQFITTKQYPYPAIRFDFTESDLNANCNGCVCLRNVVVDIYIETRKDNFHEADQLTEIIRDLFREDCGRYLTSWTETPEFQAISANVPLLNKPNYWTPGDTSFMVDSWGWKELINDHYAASDTFRQQSFVADGELQISWIRFEGQLAIKKRGV